MFGRLAIIISLLVFVIIENQGQDLPTNSRVVGVNTVHDVKIDKDTVITQNEVLPKKNPEKLGTYLNILESMYKDESIPAAIPDKEDASSQPPAVQEGTEPEPDWSYRSFPKEVNAHVTQFKKNMTECLKEVQARDRRPVKRLSPKTESPVHGECLIACVLKRNAVILNGKINKENLITLVSKFYAKDTKLMKKLEKNVDRCIEMSVKFRGDECALASMLNSCTNDLMASNKHGIAVNYK
ncbi:PBP/GOBP family domain-containing protein [Phthorimaea operculella]|nr:PBP/GOBP family domain-containing protein [Phthorimaea operculella]